MTIFCEKQGKLITDMDASKTSTESRRWMQTCSFQYVLLMLMLIFSIALSTITLIVFLTRSPPLVVVSDGNSSVHLNSTRHLDNRITRTSKDYLNTNHLYNTDKFPLIPRLGWLAVPPKHPLTPLHHPVPFIIIQHTATDGCSTAGSCSRIVNTIQAYHMDSQGWNDIGYNFLVGGDGNIYEGRGWDHVGAHTYGYNTKSIGIALIGNFNAVAPCETQILAAKQLIAQGVEEGYLAEDYKLLTARQVQATQSPGLLAYEEIKKWPHWVRQP